MGFEMEGVCGTRRVPWAGGAGLDYFLDFFTGLAGDLDRDLVGDLVGDFEAGLVEALAGVLVDLD